MKHKRLIGILVALAVAALSAFTLVSCAKDEGVTPVTKEITTAEEFLGIANYTGAKYAGSVFTLKNNIDFYGKAFVPIGSFESPFTGTIEGSGFTVSGIEFFEENDEILPEAVGLTGAAKNAVFRNLNVEMKIMRKTNAKGTYLGALAGAAYGTLTAENVNTTFEISTKYDTYSEQSSLTDSEVLTTDAVEYAGGIVGYVNGDYRIRNVSVGFSVGETYVATNAFGQMLPRVGCFLGGVVGYGTGTGTIESADVELRGFSATAEKIYAGGIAGHLVGAKVKDSVVRFEWGNSELYAAGENGKGSAGGIVGYAYGSEFENVEYQSKDSKQIKLQCDHVGKEPFHYGGIAGYLENSSLKNGKAAVYALVVNGTSFGGVAGVVRGGSIDGAEVSGSGFIYDFNVYQTYLEKSDMQISTMVGLVKGAANVKNVTVGLSVIAHSRFGKLVTERDVDQDGNFIGEPRVPVVEAA